MGIFNKREKDQHEMVKEIEEEPEEEDELEVPKMDFSLISATQEEQLYESQLETLEEFECKLSNSVVIHGLYITDGTTSRIEILNKSNLE